MDQDSFDLAGQAIEQWVEQNRPDDSGQWSEITPTDDWGFSAEQWASEAETIVDTFNALLAAGQQVDVPELALENSASISLGKFQKYLARKVELASLKAIVRKFER